MKKLLTVLLACLLSTSGMIAQEAKTEEKTEKKKEEKPVTMADFEKQFKVCKAMMNAKNDKNRPVVSSSSQRSITNYIRSSKRYLEQNQFRYAQENMENAFRYSVPEMVTVEIKALFEIMDKLIEQRKDDLLKKGDSLYQQVTDITKKNSTQDDIDNLKDKVSSLYSELSNISSSNAKLRRIRSKMEKASRFLGYWGPIQSAQQEGDFSKAIDKLQSLISNYSSYSVLPTKVLRAKIAALREEANKRFDKEVKLMRKELSEAKDSESVKKVLNKLKVFQSKYSRGFRGTTRYAEMEHSDDALQYWLNVIISEESGDYQQAVQQMRNLESNYYRNTLLLKWKEIKAKKEELVNKMLTAPKTVDPAVKAVDQQIKKCKDIDSLLAFKGRLQSLTSNYSNNRTQELYYLNNDLKALENMYNAFKSGQYTQVFQYMQYQNQNQNNHRWQKLLQQQRELLRLKSIAGMIDLDLKKLSDKEKSPDKVLLAIADKAAADKDWGKVVLILDAYAIAFYNNSQRPVWLQGELAACKNYITGMNFEKAGMLDKAIMNYSYVLQHTGSKRSPVKEAISRLKALKEQHPDLFKKKEQPMPKLIPKPKPVNIRRSIHPQEEAPLLDSK